MYQLLPLPQIIEAYGLVLLVNKQKFLGIGAGLLIFLSFIRFLPDFWFIYPVRYSRYTDYGPLAVTSYINSHPDKTFYVQDGFMHKLHILYFYKVPPKEIKLEDVNAVDQVLLRYKNIYSVLRGFKPPSKQNSVFISFEEDIPDNYRKIGTINLKDDSLFATVSRPVM